MKSKKSFYNPHIVKHELKYHGWILGLYIVMLLFSGPIASLVGEENFAWHMVRLLQYSNFMHGITIVFIPVILGVSQFKYLHNQAHIARMHSLPFSRLEWLFTKMLVGTLTIIIPQIIFALFTIICYPASSYVGAQIIHTPVSFMVMNILYMLGLYYFSVAVSLLTGVTIAATFLTLIFLTVPMGLLYLMFNNFQFMLNGFYFNEDAFFKIVLKFSPLTLIAELPKHLCSSWTALNLGIFIFVFSMLSFYLYSIRKDEMAGDVVAFSRLKPFFIAGVTICSVFVGGTYLSAIYEREISLLIGYIIGGALGFYISQMVVNKKFNVFGQYIKGFIAVSVLVMVFYFSMSMDIIGFEKRTPELSDIESIHFSSEYRGFDDANSIIYTTDENVEAILNLHNRIVNDKEYKKLGRRYYLQYTLENGSKIKRMYHLYERKERELFEIINASKEHKIQQFDIFNLDIDKIPMVVIESHEFWNNNEKLDSKFDIETLVELLKEDIMDADADDLLFKRYDHAYINFYKSIPSTSLSITKSYEDENAKNIMVSIPLNSSFKRTKKWLDDRGMLEKLVLKPERVDHITLEMINSKHYRAGISSYEKNNIIKINDINEIEFLLEAMSNSTYFDDESPYYMINVVGKDGVERNIYAYIDHEDLPEDIQKRFFKE